MNNYDDIINLPHHVSNYYPKMSLYDRSAQFAPFAALSGYGDAILETERLTDKRIIIDDDLKEIINKRLLEIKSIINDQPFVSVTYFVKDKKKEGGCYKKVNYHVKKINIDNGYIMLTNKLKIPILDIINIKMLDSKKGIDSCDL